MVTTRYVVATPDHMSLQSLTFLLPRRYYEKVISALSYFFRHQQPPADAEMAMHLCPPRTLQRLNLDKKTCGVYVGDCTERKIEDPRDPALHAYLYSQYKGCTTLKYLVRAKFPWGRQPIGQCVLQGTGLHFLDRTR